MKIMTIIGARPQFIKAASLSKELRKHHQEILVHTGQHYDKNMSEIFFDELGIPIPNYNLGVGSGTHGEQTGRMIVEIEKILLKECPDAVIIYGDTNSTLAGAISTCKLHIPLFHVEAGLRSFNMKMPEEQNRVLSDRISNILFCPTENATRNLINEGILDGVYNVGDIMYDVLLSNIKYAEKKYSLTDINTLLTKIDKNINVKEKKYYLSTIHRAENTDDKHKLITIFTAFEKLDFPVIIPLHPRTKKIINDEKIVLKNTFIIDPVGYLFMIFLASNAKMIITDSGGLQKESYLLKIPCTTLRNETEWIETQENNWNVLCEIDEQSILNCVNRKDIGPYPTSFPFGDGNTAILIVNIINEYFMRITN